VPSTTAGWNCDRIVGTRDALGASERPAKLLVQHGVYRAAFGRAGRQTPSR
jgi:hypothetical protein